MGAANSTVTLVICLDRTLLPVYEGALGTAEGWPWSIRRTYMGALLIRATGEVKRVSHVKISGPHGTSLPSRILSVLNSNWAVSLLLAQVESNNAELAAAALEGLKLDRSSGRNLFDRVPAESSERLSTGLNHPSDLFALLGVNHPDFTALDPL